MATSGRPDPDPAPRKKGDHDPSGASSETPARMIGGGGGGGSSTSSWHPPLIRLGVPIGVEVDGRQIWTGVQMLWRSARLRLLASTMRALAPA